MRTKLQILVLILLGSSVAAASGPAQSPQAGGEQTGFQLLDRLVVLLVKAAAPGGGADVGPDIVLLARDLKSAREQKRVDDLFAVRYSRLLSAVRQGILKDPEVLYWPMYRFTMMDFIEERTGRMPDWKEVLFHVHNHGGSGGGLALLADAIMSEVVSLHIHLETLSTRPQILKSYMEKSMKPAVSGPSGAPARQVGQGGGYAKKLRETASR